MLTGAEPVIPLDLQEATWLTDPPNGFTTTAELIGARAKALAKHRDFVEDVRRKVHKDKIARVAQYEKNHKATIKDFDFKPGDLVLMRNTAIESSLDKKMKPRYLGPLVVIARNKGGAYIVAEMDGSVHQSSVAAFRLVPYHARKQIKLPSNVHKVIDMGASGLKEMIEETDPGDEREDYMFKGMPKGSEQVEGELLDLEEDAQSEAELEKED